MADAIDRLMGNFSLGRNGCWVWNLGLTTDGYGKVKLFGRTLTFHRLMYQLFKGEIPKELTVDHLCRNRACGNPDHLEAVTMRENLMRGNTAARKNLSKTHCPQGHEYSPENTYHYSDGRRMCRSCDRHKAKVRARKKRLTWQT